MKSIKKFKIIASKTNIYTGQVKKLKDESKLQTEVIYIEDLVTTEKNSVDFKDSIVYFLCCNSPLVPAAIQRLENEQCHIINKNYLTRNYSKLEVQTLLYNNNVKVPEIYFTDNFENIEFPVFCKENRHEGIIVQAYNRITLERFFNKFNNNEFYLEEAISNNGIKEFKVYFVEGKVFLKDINNNTEILNEMCKKISGALDNMEVFSTDIIQDSNGEYFIIDVNPSAGFYLSDSGRKYFLDRLIQK